MSPTLPATGQEVTSWTQVEPVFAELAERPLSADTISAWLVDWSHLSERIDETHARFYIATTQDTTDQAAEDRYHAFIGDILPRAQAADQTLKQRLLSSGLEPEGFEIPLRNLRAEAELFRDENLPLLTEERKLASRLNRILGAQAI
ncbi:MAG: M3 family oligoendopeptidase, partial [Anaerolineae bacterium]|nr:M3 family oligoendopeptidase [Anaerolineae bacterium]